MSRSVDWCNILCFRVTQIAHERDYLLIHYHQFNYQDSSSLPARHTQSFTRGLEIMQSANIALGAHVIFFCIQVYQTCWNKSNKKNSLWNSMGEVASVEGKCTVDGSCRDPSSWLKWRGEVGRKRRWWGTGWWHSKYQQVIGGYMWGGLIGR